MKVDPFTDAIMGDWKLDKKTKVKDKLCYRRQACITLHKDHAQEQIDPSTHKIKKIHGEVVLKETKMVDKESSNVSLFREIETTEKSVIKDIIV